MYCQQCGQRIDDLNLGVCAGCDTNVKQAPNPSSATLNPHRTLRRDFAVAYVLALLTGISWMAQGPGLWFLNPLNLIYFPYVLSVLARVSFILSFIRVSFNWLVISSYASACSLVIAFGMNGYLLFERPAVVATWIFSLATLTSVIILSKKHQKSLVKLDRKW